MVCIKNLCRAAGGGEGKMAVGRAVGGGAVHLTVWARPSEGWFKVNVDAGMLGEVGTGLGVVCRDDAGAFYACAAVQFKQVWQPVVAEAMAVLWGLRVARDVGLVIVVLESDCLVVIRALQNQLQGLNSLHLIIDDILMLVSIFEDVT